MFGKESQKPNNYPEKIKILSILLPKVYRYWMILSIGDFGLGKKLECLFQKHSREVPHCRRMCKTAPRTRCCQLYPA